MRLIKIRENCENYQRYSNSSIALVNDLILVTHNVREFSLIEGLKIEDWEAE
ncbi:hypothetical protein [Okeania sp. KiyG1]|uniref:hypothetical protein n=1 Tax=Okeania sp. KiyG1 TaxID=2720165 RepID=UPI0019941779|nr:hypothetical protein [Okeania sp. KiyG1]GFZ96707.1 hypothetical protein CYANOKiyG1_07790 [Okeania sp. KiyG1]